MSVRGSRPTQRGDACLLPWGSPSPTRGSTTVGRGLGRMQSPDSQHLSASRAVAGDCAAEPCFRARAAETGGHLGQRLSPVNTGVTEGRVKLKDV